MKGKAKVIDICEEASELVRSGGHTIEFSACKDKEDDRRLIFKTFKSKLDHYKRGHKMDNL